MSHARVRGLGRWRSIALAVLVMVAVIVPAASAQAIGVGSPMQVGFAPPIQTLGLPPIIPPWKLTVPQPSKPATITGVVKNASNVGVGGLTVRVSGDTPSSSTISYFMQTAVTKADGSFCIADLVEGTYDLWIEDPQLRYRETSFWHGDDGVSDTRQQINGGTTKDAGTIVVPANGTVSGRAMKGATPVVGALVVANVMDPATEVWYYRETTTKSDGTWTIADAPAGLWKVTIHGVGNLVPASPMPIDGQQMDGDIPVVAQSQYEEFSLAEGQTLNIGDTLFVAGASVNAVGLETFSGNSYLVPNTTYMAVSEDDPNDVYYWSAGSDEWGRAYLPPGIYTLSMAAPGGFYEPLDIGMIAVSGGGDYGYPRQMTAAPGTFAVTGQISQTGAGPIQGKVKAEYAGTSPDSWPDEIGDAGMSNGDGKYLVRLPANPSNFPDLMVTPGYKPRLIFTDNNVNTHVPSAPWNVTGTTNVVHNASLAVGGVIDGTVRDEAGNPVPGVQVSARTKQNVPGRGLMWVGDDKAWTLTDAAGHYSLSGLKANADYKVLFAMYFDYGGSLPEKYEVYHRKAWQNKPWVDSLVDMATPPSDIVDHTPVDLGLGDVVTCDETITPGGYVALHADGPTNNPTGSVWCDVMYEVPGANGKPSQWFEIDSGFTTGGTFQKMWKVLPPGHYNLNYSDYFGRGSGTWDFQLNAGDTKYGSILVPAPVTYLSAAPNVSGAFAGIINGGLDLGGTGGVNLNVTKLPSLPTTAPVIPPTIAPLGSGAYEFDVDGAAVNGVWTLTLPYDTSVADSLVSNIRVAHLKQDNTWEWLKPISWNTIKHTVQVQTLSLSPFKVVYAKTKVSLPTPVAPATASHTKSFTVYGTIAPKHTNGLKSVQLKIYKLTNHKWKPWGSAWTKNYKYASGKTWYRASLKLKAGSYRFYAYAPNDSWHLAVTSSSYRQTKVK